MIRLSQAQKSQFGVMGFVQKALLNLVQRRERLQHRCLLPATVHPRQRGYVDNVDRIFKELKSKHSDMENTKLRLWAKLIEKGHYDDLDNPLQIPLITGSPASPKKKRDNISTALVDAATVVAKAFQTSHTSTAVTTDGSLGKHRLPRAPFKVISIQVCPIAPKLFGRFESPKRLVQAFVESLQH